MNRLASLEGEQFDVAVIGGGIVGCGVARDAALRGLRVLLVEKADFGSGTTSGSTRIVHGGLRYLRMLDFRLVRLDLRERETLLRIAPHLVGPLEFLIPFLKGNPISPITLRFGLALYDALSRGSSLPASRSLSAAEAREAEELLRRPDLRGAIAYHDARIDSPERLALENVLDAEAHGGRALNYCEAVSARIEAGHVTGLHIRDLLEQTEAIIRARVVVNATGAWLDLVHEKLTARRSTALRTTKGIHIACPPLTRHALVFFSRRDHRMMFAIPRQGLTWIGTTDTDYSGDPSHARADRADVEYVVESSRQIFPTLRTSDVLYTNAGVRALVRRSGAASSVSRMHRIVDGEPLAPAGMISVLGGKITGYRAIAEEVTDQVCRRLGHGRASVTGQRPLPGAADGKGPENQAGPQWLISHLWPLYGVKARQILALGQAGTGLEHPLSPLYPDIAAQVVYAVRHEHCVHASDFLRRRTMLWAAPDQGLDALEGVAGLMARELGWTPAQREQEIAAYRQHCALALAFRR